MVLFDNIVEVLDLPDLNLCVVRRVVALERCGVGATLVDGNLRGIFTVTGVGGRSPCVREVAA